MRILSREKVQAKLVKICLSLDKPFSTLCLKVVNDRRFLRQIGSTKKHHTEEGGLARHTLEVAEFAQASCRIAKNLDRNVILTACIWHDFGKIYDTVFKDPEFPRIQTGAWVHAPHHELVYHVARSYHEWMAATPDLNARVQEAVAHCILAHHGRVENRSVVVPQTPEAWAVHLADMSSCFVTGARSPAA